MSQKPQYYNNINNLINEATKIEINLEEDLKQELLILNSHRLHDEILNLLDIESLVE